ncbi:MAG: DEAD/DEAH box helicase [Bacteroidales bacterium]
MKFEQYNLAPEIHRNIAEAGFRRPTDIQYKSLGPIMHGDDVLAIAQTGTGKTAAFAIPVINMLHEKKFSSRSDGVRCLVMVPTRELALQITEVFQAFCEHTRVKTFCLMGGVEQDPQIAKLEKGVDIVVSTPGRMFDLVSQGHLELSKIEILILDEADHMLDLGFINDIQQLVKKLPRNRQTLFFSATINPYIKKVAYSLVTNPIRIQISPKDPVARNIEHSVAFIEMDDKRFFLERMVNENPESKILVFVRTKVRAERVNLAMDKLEIKCETIHGDKEQTDRLQVMKRFKSGDFKILIATDVSARGIDIPNVDFVVNYDLPEKPENYVHRVGRTGRADKKGIAVSFCSNDEKPLLEEIESYIGKPVEIMNINKQDYTETLAFTAETKSDWKTLLREAEEQELKRKKKKKK